MKPHFQIPGYLNRWRLIPRNKWFNIYLHQFVGPDPGVYAHDHPWWNVTIKLWGDYMETRDVLGNGVYQFLWNKVTIRNPTSRHIIYDVVTPDCWTLFITGPVVRDWGFWVDGKWVNHNDYLDAIQDGEMPSPKLSAVTKVRLLGAHVAYAGRHTRGRQ